MAGPEIPSYTQLVYDVVRESDEPLTVDQIVAAVNARRPITTKNPKTTIRNVLGNGWQLVSVGNRRYGYLPRLVNGSVLRIPLAGEETVSGPLAYPDEVRDALWPGFFENQSRRDLRPVQLTLPTGDVVALPLEQVPSFYRWGTQVVPDALREYLSQQQAQPDDSLVIRVVDGEAGRGEAEFSSRRDRDETAISQRNRLLADEVEHILRKGQARGRMTWEITIPLLARGYYQDPLAPDPLFTVLAADKRFVESGWGVWELTDTLTPEMVEMIEFNKALTEAMLESDAKLAMEDDPNVREYASSDDPLVFLDSLYPHGLPSQPSALTPLDRAQDLIYEAWETPNRRKRLRLARKALQISPDCADAYVILGNDSAHDAQEAADLYARGVAAGERALGSDVFDANVGYFWSILETRPYMRARGCLAEALWALGRRDEAIAHIWEMLRLNPGDNQGVRYWLLNWLLELGDDAGARRLLKQYPDEITAIWQYGRALQAFRTGGDSKRAQKLLTEAQMWNPFVPPYLLGTKRLPSELPQYYSLGQDSEAVYCAMSQMTVWLGTPGAIDWLRKRTA